MLLSLVNNTNHIFVKEVLSDWLNEPIDRTQCRDDIYSEGELCSSLIENGLDTKRLTLPYAGAKRTNGMFF